MEYDIIYTDYCREQELYKALDELKERVNDRLKSGWKLVGGINSSSHTGESGEYIHFYQAMKKE